MTFEESVEQATQLMIEAKAQYELLGKIMELCKIARADYDKAIDRPYHSPEYEEENYYRGKENLATDILYTIKGFMESENNGTSNGTNNAKT